MNKHSRNEFLLKTFIFHWPNRNMMIVAHQIRVKIVFIKKIIKSVYIKFDAITIILSAINGVFQKKWEATTCTWKDKWSAFRKYIANGRFRIKDYIYLWKTIFINVFHSYFPLTFTAHNTSLPHKSKLGSKMKIRCDGDSKWKWVDKWQK